MTRIPMLIGLAALCLTTARADETWLRIHDPEPAARSQLAAEAIDYGSFLWVPGASARNLAAAARVQRFENPFALHIDHARIDPLEGFNGIDTEWLETGSGAGRDFRLVQFQGPVKTEWLEQLRTAGIEPVQYLAPFSYIVWADAQALDAGRALSRVRYAGDFPPVLRVPVQARQTDEIHPHSMGLIHAGTAETVIARLEAAGARVVSATRLGPDLEIVQLLAAPDRYLELARIPGVLTIQHIGQNAGPRGEMSQQSIVGNYDGGNNLFPGYLTWLNPTGLDGSGVTVGIVDGGIYDSHPDLVDNIVPCTGSGASCNDSINSHGTHVAGAVGGTGVSGITDPAGFLRGQGVAPGVSLVEQRYGPLLGGGPGGMVPEGMLIIYRDSADSGAQLTNNSWGPTITPQGYDIPTMEIDFISRDADPDTTGQQPVLAVWSIMNGNGDSGGACSPSSLASPDEAKNLFAVGSTKLQTGVGSQTTDIFDVSSNSAHGPACDGRQVPHIVAPGCNTDAPDSSTGYGLKCGTSMASPVVSGSVSLFWEWYRNEFSSEPSPALVKAVFTPMAMDLEGFRDADNGIMDHRPDRKQGWGRIDLDAVINPPNTVWYYNQETVFTGTGQDWNQVILPDDPAEPIRLMLAWTDAPGPGTGGATPAWVNDLDLVVTADGSDYLGNVFGSDGFSDTGGSADSMNNMEGAFLRADQHNGGSVTINITAANIAEDALDPHDPGSPRQDFAIACYNCLISGEIYADGFENVSGK